MTRRNSFSHHTVANRIPVPHIAALCLIAISIHPRPSLAATPEADSAVVEALMRMNDPKGLITSNRSVKESVNRYLDEHQKQTAFLNVVERFSLSDKSEGLLRFLSPDIDDNLQTKAIQLLLANGKSDALAELLGSPNDSRPSIIRALGFVGGEKAIGLLKPVLTGEAPVSLKNAATDALGRSRSGQVFLRDLHREGRLPEGVRYAAYNALIASGDPELKRIATEELKTADSNDGKALPPIWKLASQRGDGKAGKKLFFGKATCGKCHQVHGEGKEVGPDLSEIGSKLSREAIYTAILNPNAGISHNYEQYSLLTIDGLALSGLLVSQDDNQITIKTAEGVTKSIPRDELEIFQQKEVSLMPENLHQLVTVQELLDLVDYMVLLKNKQQSGFHVLNNQSSEPSDRREPNQAVTGLKVAEGLDVRLFSAEPQLRNPSNLDVDHLGRVWVCEVVNYRHFRNPYNPVREEGDRILVLEDTDADGRADRQTVFYQGTDVNSAHGVCVLGDRVIVSAGDKVLSFRDSDGDLRADEKTVLFSGIGGVEHDHGIHAFIPGPDGKLYFNFGNEGHQLKGPDGESLQDLSGREVSDHGKPYRQGMVFRCDVDGGNLETLGWNFRNNWEVCLDSFGTLWQSDNDDDGNRATRINYVMPGGNFGYKDELTGASWSMPRTGMSKDVPLRHWHLNDPGVVPNVLQTGAGSPTGITVYEGEMLPKAFQGQVIHCDPGPNSVRVYHIMADGAGYGAHQTELLSATTDKWFRPVDVCVAPDGSLIIADWYDPGVGGHRMGDTERGRVFRVSAKEATDSYKSPAFDLFTFKGALDGLQSPNLSARFLAAQSLRQFGERSIPALEEWISETRSPLMQARGLWVLNSIDSDRAFKLAAQHPDENIRVVAIRMASQSGRDDLQWILPFATDDSSVVRREAALALRGKTSPKAAELWATIASTHDGNDRWMLEALGISARGNWNACLQAWLEMNEEKWDTPGGRDLIWRSRADVTPELLAQIVVRSAKDDSNADRYFRAFDFQADSDRKRESLATVVNRLASEN